MADRIEADDKGNILDLMRCCCQKRPGVIQADLGEILVGGQAGVFLEYFVKVGLADIQRGGNVTDLDIAGVAVLQHIYCIDKPLGMAVYHISVLHRRIAAEIQLGI